MSQGLPPDSCGCQNYLFVSELPSGLDALNAAARQWLDSIANVRIHGETRQKPVELFAVEKAHLKALPPLPADTAITDTVRVNGRFRIRVDTNRYPVPSRYTSQRLMLFSFYFSVLAVLG